MIFWFKLPAEFKSFKMPDVCFHFYVNISTVYSVPGLCSPCHSWMTLGKLCRHSRTKFCSHTNLPNCFSQSTSVLVNGWSERCVPVWMWNILSGFCPRLPQGSVETWGALSKGFPRATNNCSCDITLCGLCFHLWPVFWVMPNKHTEAINQREDLLRLFSCRSKSFNWTHGLEAAEFNSGQIYCN